MTTGGCQEPRPVSKGGARDARGSQLHPAGIILYPRSGAALIYVSAPGPVDKFGQTSWLTAEEQDRFIEWLRLSWDSHLLDVACGSDKPTLRIARMSGCRVFGIDLHDEGIARANAGAIELGLEQRAAFRQANPAEVIF